MNFGKQFKEGLITTVLLAFFTVLLGFVLGLVLGRFLHAWMVVTVEVDLVMFGRTAPLYAYLLAAALTVLSPLAGLTQLQEMRLNGGEATCTATDALSITPNPS